MIELMLLNNELEKNEIILNHLKKQINEETLNTEELYEFQEAVKSLEKIIPGIKHSIKTIELLKDNRTIRDV